MNLKKSLSKFIKKIKYNIEDFDNTNNNLSKQELPNELLERDIPFKTPAFEKGTITETIKADHIKSCYIPSTLLINKYDDLAYAEYIRNYVYLLYTENKFCLDLLPADPKEEDRVPGKLKYSDIEVHQTRLYDKRADLITINLPISFEIDDIEKMNVDLEKIDEFINFTPIYNLDTVVDKIVNKLCETHLFIEDEVTKKELKDKLLNYTRKG